MKNLILATLLCACVGLSEAAAGSYEPIPKGWNIKIGLPGKLSVGAEYCTALGECRTVGDDIVGFSIGGTPVGGVEGCSSMLGDGGTIPEPCLKAEILVEVLASNSNGVAIVRLNRKNYAVGGGGWYRRTADGSFVGGPVSVVYQGISMPLQIYQLCFPPAGSTSTIIQMGSDSAPCPPNSPVRRTN